MGQCRSGSEATTSTKAVMSINGSGKSNILMNKVQNYSGKLPKLCYFAAASEIRFGKTEVR